jgi:hypothetical protein
MLQCNTVFPVFGFRASGALRLQIEATVWLTCQRCMSLYPRNFNFGYCLAGGQKRG